MALNIKNAETEKLARELARRRHVGLTEAVHRALEQAMAMERDLNSADDRKRYVRELQARVAASGTADRETLDALMYDGHGLPR